MKAEITQQLARIRRTLSEGDEAWGPDSGDSTEHGEGEAGEGGAENVSDVGDTFAAYISGILDSVLEEYEVEEEDALDYIFGVASSLEEDGTLPPIPDEEDAEATAIWLGKAKSLLFGELVLASLEAEVEGAESEE